MKLIFQVEGREYARPVKTIKEGARLAAHLEKNRGATDCEIQMNDNSPACDVETWARQLAGARTMVS